ncbi:MAG: hypothetical protein FD189_1725 [Elusimicrobia bacterium]|nr:MAG: hypothetical protein FD154_1891 [Elusimicrobiota bacterium]KAF0154684.1 MAG: hypothetical protein FD189_1725 [Elusimicrobiota bacterium]
MNPEKIKILKMLEEKRITSEEAMQLLEAVDKVDKVDKAGEAAPRRGRFLRIRVYEGEGEKAKVNINVPLGWSKLLAPFIEGKIKARLQEKGYDIDLGKIQEYIESGEAGRIVDVQDGKSKVEIYID